MTKSNPQQMGFELFGETGDECARVERPRETMIEYFDQQRALQPHADYVGFKWKTSCAARRTPAFDDAWECVPTSG